MRERESRFLSLSFVEKVSSLLLALSPAFPFTRACARSGPPANKHKKGSFALPGLGEAHSYKATTARGTNRQTEQQQTGWEKEMVWYFILLQRKTYSIDLIKNYVNTELMYMQMSNPLDSHSSEHCENCKRKNEREYLKGSFLSLVLLRVGSRE